MESAEVKKITIVDEKPVSERTRLIRLTVVWTYLVVAEGVSHAWFGGSLVIDILIVVVLVVWGSEWTKKSGGTTVEMTTDELKRWVDARMPLNAKAWLAEDRLARRIRAS